MNLAGAHALPVVFVVVNNGWAISVPVAEQTAAQTLAQKAIAAGIPGVQVDGNDIIGVRAVMQAAMDRARAGDGPTLVEALTYRLSDHTTADDATRYRPAGELEAAWRNEPLLRTRRYLESLGIWDEAREKSLRAQCTAQVDAAVQAYQATAKAGSDAMFDHLFATLPEHLVEQQQTARRYAGGHG
jgi:pyruvate dehydrogenase E1 component alpha subunit